MGLAVVGALVAIATTTAVGAATAGSAPRARAAGAFDDLPLVRVDRDDLRVTGSCRLLLPDTPIIDLNGDGVVQVTGDDLVVDLGGGTLRGRIEGTAPWDRSGLGIVVQGRGVTLRNGAVRGFQVGVLATGADGFVAEDLDLSGNWGARLRSGRNAEDGADWLWPHANDSHEWRTRYGAALCIERSAGVTVRRVRAIGQGGQNGIVLDRVDDSSIHDNDCSFLSGWGLALWRSSRNTITRNAFDFCVRGYSHGVYNRGQDSAGILMFEQCSQNLIALNSVTHGGDGLFVFAGTEALGPDLPDGAGADDPAAVASKGRGCNGNVIVDNDFSHAVAHGIELTFSFDNIVARNILAGCGITGLWGGYSRGTIVMGNTFDGNGVQADNPGEQAGMSAEHAEDLLIMDNTFRNQGVAIKLWWDEDPGLLRKAWAIANGAGCEGNTISANRFIDCGTAIELRRCAGTRIGVNALERTDRALDADAESAVVDDAPVRDPDGRPIPNESVHRFADAVRRTAERLGVAPGRNEPIGDRASFGGREGIVMTPEGPWDGSRPLLVLDAVRDGVHEWRLLGEGRVVRTQIHGRAGFDLEPTTRQRTFRVRGHPGWVAPYRLSIEVEGRDAPLEGLGTIVSAAWKARFFAWTVDPRDDAAGWRREAEGGVSVELPSLDLRYGGDGPSQIVRDASVEAAALPRDRFGMIASTRVRIPAGRWRLRVLSDDGVRLRAQGHTLVDRWTWHAPTEDLAEITADGPSEVELEVEHFELDGHAVLSLSIEPLEPGSTVPPPTAE